MESRGGVLHEEGRRELVDGQDADSHDGGVTFESGAVEDVDGERVFALALVVQTVHMCELVSVKTFTIHLHGQQQHRSHVV